MLNERKLSSIALKSHLRRFDRDNELSDEAGLWLPIYSPKPTAVGGPKRHVQDWSSSRLVRWCLAHMQGAYTPGREEVEDLLPNRMQHQR
ncbi:hypothetical protein PSCICN_52550 [Pseudomonas cichorii]|nr:hypothetical protein PSCICN_52550 [Pseudomonas cichorii]